ncbi:hypothetical protein, partial [Paraburkholderia ultramafica]|uniref:hypothetical protein n=1 Tax=Paraburkholderia ultramafica TaxID=1544867 RepID=UPI001582240B
MSVMISSFAISNVMIASLYTRAMGKDGRLIVEADCIVTQLCGISLPASDLATRMELFDFVVQELRRREPQDARRIRRVRVALQN